MARRQRSSALLNGVITVGLFNIFLFIVGVQWASEILSELAVGSRDESVIAAAQRAGQANSLVASTLKIVLGVSLIPLTFLFVGLALRYRQVLRRQRQAEEIQSYQNNLNRARRARRRERAEATDAP